LASNARPRRRGSFDLSQQVPALCALIALLAAGGTGWWYWSLRQESRRLDAETRRAKREVAQLKSAMSEVEKFEARSALLQERVKLIEQLRTGQACRCNCSTTSAGASRLPVADGAAAGRRHVTIEGRSTTLIALSDFVGNLGNSASSRNPSKSSAAGRTGDATKGGRQGRRAVPDLISFVVRAQVVGAQVTSHRGQEEGTRLAWP
jgi:hypothetical protein